MKFLFISSQVEDRITTLKKSGKEGQTLAGKVEDIIFSLKSGNRLKTGERSISLTKYGENRIKNCRKYNLGCGYRLIILKRDETLFLPMLGSHDDCDRWLNNNSQLKTFDTTAGKLINIKKKSSEEISDDISEEDLFEDDENYVSEKLTECLTDRELRQVFCGLVK